MFATKALQNTEVHHIYRADTQKKAHPLLYPSQLCSHLPNGMTTTTCICEDSLGVTTRATDAMLSDQS